MHKTQQRNRLITGILAALVIIAVIFGALYFGPTARAVRADEAAKNLVTAFGAELKNVSLLGDDATVSQSIETTYGPFITPELLADWKSNPDRAPGRTTSSPMPDRLGIGSVTPQGEGRVINGEVILVESADSATEPIDTVPFVAFVIPTDNGWKIAAYQEETVQTLKKLPTTDEDIPGAR